MNLDPLPETGIQIGSGPKPQPKCEPYVPTHTVAWLYLDGSRNERVTVEDAFELLAKQMNDPMVTGVGVFEGVGSSDLKAIVQVTRDCSDWLKACAEGFYPGDFRWVIHRGIG